MNLLDLWLVLFCYFFRIKYQHYYCSLNAILNSVWGTGCLLGHSVAVTVSGVFLSLTVHLKTSFEPLGWCLPFFSPLSLCLSFSFLPPLTRGLKQVCQTHNQPWTEISAVCWSPASDSCCCAPARKEGRKGGWHWQQNLEVHVVRWFVFLSEQGEEWKWEQNVHTTQSSGWPGRQGSAQWVFLTRCGSWEVLFLERRWWWGWNVSNLAGWRDPCPDVGMKDLPREFLHHAQLGLQGILVTFSCTIASCFSAWR